MKSSFKYLLFDWDGCLADTLEIWTQGWYQTFQAYGLDITRERVIQEALVDWRLPEKLGVSNPAKFREDLYTNITPAMAAAKLRPEVLNVLTALKGNDKKIALVTSSRKTVVEPALVKNQIYDLIDVFLGEEDVANFKPDPEIIYKALSKVRASVTETLMIGDSANDVNAGKAASVQTALYFPEKNLHYYDEVEMLKLDADYMIRDFNDLLMICG